MNNSLFMTAFSDGNQVTALPGTAIANIPTIKRRLVHDQMYDVSISFNDCFSG